MWFNGLAKVAFRHYTVPQIIPAEHFAADVVAHWARLTMALRLG
ncbi:hypothetical protein XBKQ1_540004 [Xenorhabdus bovienii str. kraussei Quebec]|uniref:Uncharacterized protein n=1 Tax=Xenorhabdus bovienii str. kraussei Quebec TaxID=1398203 RepID=A0A077PAU1_XENBV|nr:hypothetical protein XBKQ1_540004 [Xenorhabdus bovienii str. kraussei Quebec]